MKCIRGSLIQVLYGKDIAANNNNIMLGNGSNQENNLEIEVEGQVCNLWSTSFYN